jgi:hypothetical protein
MAGRRLALLTDRQGPVVPKTICEYPTDRFRHQKVCSRGPGAQLQRIGRAALRAGGRYEELPSELALSRSCVCDGRHRKPLSERRHRCPVYGLDLDRDLFSAFVGRHAKEADGRYVLDLDAARAELFGIARASDERSRKASPREHRFGARTSARGRRRPRAEVRTGESDTAAHRGDGSRYGSASVWPPTCSVAGRQPTPSDRAGRPEDGTNQPAVHVQGRGVRVPGAAEVIVRRG